MKTMSMIMTETKSEALSCHLVLAAMMADVPSTTSDLKPHSSDSCFSGVCSELPVDAMGLACGSRVLGVCFRSRECDQGAFQILPQRAEASVATMRFFLR